jgi:hypothetical protein
VLDLPDLGGTELAQGEVDTDGTVGVVVVEAGGVGLRG